MHFIDKEDGALSDVRERFLGLPHAS